MERCEVWGTSPLLVYLDPWWGSSKSLFIIFLLFLKRWKSPSLFVQPNLSLTKSINFFFPL